MLTKAATHIRPLLRLQSHAHQPDLFTSNPSLLHHFQPAGVSNSLVAAQNASASSGASGAAGGAGRSGYSGASSGGGYTGHARAFLSLPQGPGADASSLAASAEDKKDAAARQRAQIAIKQRIAAREEASKPPTRVVMVRDQLSARAGSRQVKMIEMEPASEEAAPSAKRSSIAYPAWAALPADAAAGGALWLPGAAPRPLGARAFHSRAARPQLVSATPTPEANRLEQPNRVLMDLAGLDIARPTSPRTQVRRNSTASVVRPAVDEFVPQVDSTQADKNIWEALSKFTKDGSREDIVNLVNHYRTPRDQEPESAALASQYPLPAGFTTATYNACISALLARRNRGESIAAILDIYNEMLARDVVPNQQTTQFVIQALCLREEDVAAASRRWEYSSEWNAFKEEKLGLSAKQTEGDLKAAEAIHAYQSEGNLASAIKLYNVAASFYPKSKNLFASTILQAAAVSVGLPYAVSLDKVLPIVKARLSDERSIKLDTLADIFEILAAAGSAEKELTLSAYERFTSQPNRGPDGEPVDNRNTLKAAASALVSVGEVDEAMKMATKAGSTHARTIFSAIIAALAKTGRLDAAFKLFDEQISAKNTLVPSEMYVLAEALAAAGRLDDATAVVANLRNTIAQNIPGLRTDHGRVSLIWAKGLAYVLSLEDSAARIAVYDKIEKLFLEAGPRLDPSVVMIFINLAIEAGKASEIARLMGRWGAQTRPVKDDMDGLRNIFTTAVFAKDMTLAAALDVSRSFARLGVPVQSSDESMSIAQRIVELYVAARAKADSVVNYADHWFRLAEAFAYLPSSYIESGAADAAIEQFLKDIAVAPSTGNAGPSQLATSPIGVELATMTTYRLGVERAAELLTAAFGEAAAALIPTPEASIAAESETTFTLPPTPASAAPPSHLQPPSAHTLHMSPKLDQLIERITFPSANLTPDRVYGTIRKALTQDNEVPSPQGLARLIPAIARAGEEPKARELYSLAQVVLASCISDPVAQAEGWRIIEDSMIAACCFLGHLEQAGMHRARIIEAGMVPSADSYATMIASSRDSTDEALVARELFEEAQAMGVIPTLYLYNTIISKLSKARKAEMALELFNRMKAQGLRPSSVTYGAVINACSRVGDAESAANLFEEMTAQRNFRPRVPPFNTMMQLHLQTRPSRERVLHYYDAMRAANVRPSAHTYKLLLDTYGTLAPIDLKAMDRVFGDLCRDNQVGVQGTHWASLITAFGIHAGDLDRALAIFDSIPSHPSTRPGSKLEPVVWEAILNVVGQVGSLEQLQKLHAQLTASGSPSTAYVCNVLISGYSRHGALQLSRNVFEGMGDSLTGFAAPNNHPALLTSSGHVKPATTAPDTTTVFREPSTYEAMIRAEVAAGNRDAAEAVLRRMEERRYPVAVWMKARAIIDEAIVNPIPPTPQVNATVAQAAPAA